MSYQAPLKDMRFVLNELAGLGEVAKLPGYQDATPDTVDAILEQASKFASEVLDPINYSGDREGSVWKDGAVTTPKGFKQAYKQYVEGGWGALPFGPEHGGQGLPKVVATAVEEMLTASNMSFSLCPLLTQGAIHALELVGSEDLKEAYLGKMTVGTWTGTMNLTEPQAGSDLALVKTRAKRAGDHYLISGQKIFITYGEHDLAENIIHLVLARTPDAPEGTRGISLFIVPKHLVNADGSVGARNDVRCLSIEHKMGIHASPTCVLAYGEQGGATGYLVGEENEGLRLMFIMMNHARLGVGMEGVAIAERAYQHALNYAKTRVQGRELGVKSGDRVTIIHHPDVRRMLMTMKAQTQAARALAYSAAAALDLANRHPDKAKRASQQALVDLLTPIVKGWSTELAVEIASIGVQIHGGMGFIEETGAAQFYRDARITTIYEGTTGIQALDLVGRKVASEGGQTMRAAIAELQRLDRDLARGGNEDLASMRTAIADAAGRLEEATRWLIDAFARDPREAAAGAVPYLKLAGIVLGAGLMARSAVIAQKRLAAGSGDAEFYRAKITTARFYCEHVLPQAAALTHTITNGAASTLALSEAQF